MGRLMVLLYEAKDELRYCHSAGREDQMVTRRGIASLRPSLYQGVGLSVEEELHAKWRVEGGGR